MNKPFRLTAALLLMAIVSVALAACGSGGPKVVTSQETESPAAAVEIAEPVQTGDAVASIPVPVPADTPADTTVELVVDSTDDPEVGELTAVAEMTDSVELVVNAPAETEVVEETVESTLLTSYSDYGFNLKLDFGAEIQANGWTEAEPSETQGIIAFTYGGVNTNLVWGPPEERTNLTFLADTYNILRASQPSVTFESISDGELTISEQEGVYGGFKAVGDGGASLGGGLIGAWTCGDNNTAFRMTLTGEDATIVQLRFDRLLENFACSSS